LNHKLFFSELLSIRRLNVVAPGPEPDVIQIPKTTIPWQTPSSTRCTAAPTHSSETATTWWPTLNNVYFVTDEQAE